MKNTLKFLLALGDSKMVIIDNEKGPHHIYTAKPDTKQRENSLKRIAQTFFMD
ncbi:hypothetical protein Emin_1373 [Elusimicrobium minutum Pei191]|uniref:Uncharacterized protein n=1 Tax=Elusimicrobium minutum (strain Pei191) TaxID=445932 RepID=B2KEH7_ELUMP|nr:hypothetical protein [Elusimicrobium minutum]ACC98923.1 hypothetical protein Emin_1373 [Elusimicrobium minutum Pei191]